MSYTLFHLSSSPYGSVLARESLDVLLAYAAFGLPVKALFIGDGVYQLVSQQNPVTLVNLEKIIQAFEIYDIPMPGVCALALDQRNLDLGNLSVQAQIVSPEEIKQWHSNARHVLSF